MTRNQETVEHALGHAARRYLHTYFTHRDLPGTMELFSKSMSGFGTGVDEVAATYEEMATLYERDCSQAPDSVRYELRNDHVLALSPESGIYSCQLNISTMIQNQALRLNGLRLTLAFRREMDAWRICHMHLSLPTTAHESDEAYPIKELEARATVLERLVNEKTHALNVALEEIRRLAVTDKLTGLHNRHMLDDILNMETERAQRHGNVFSVVLMDIDNFKKLNDTKGHAVGDEVLKEFGQLLRSRLRKLDVPGRWGGEEFLVICPETTARQAAALAEIIRATIATTPFPMETRITSSFGVATHRFGDTPASLVSRADTALYQAKRQGRDCVIVAAA